jgi:hypothetical protein
VFLLPVKVYPYLVEFPMKFEAVPGSAPVFGLEIVDLAVLSLAVPALLGIFVGLRKETAVFAAVVVGAVVVLAH